MGGSGAVRANGRELSVAAGDTFAVPAAVLDDLQLESSGELDLIACLPPRAADLDRHP